MRGATMRDEQRGVPADELEELEGNALAEKTLEIVDRLRPHTNAILLGLGGLLVALATLRRRRGGAARWQVSRA